MKTVFEEIKKHLSDEGITLYVFKTKKDISRYNTKHKNYSKNIVCMTVEDIQEYGLDGYRIKEYMFMEDN